MTEVLRITKDDLYRKFDFGPHSSVPDDFVRNCDGANTTYREPTRKEYEEYILYVLKKIAAPGITRSRKENLEAFERGWRENLELLMKSGVSATSLKPKYFRPNKFLRYEKKLVVSENLDLEYDLFNLSRHIMFSKYLRPYKNIYEIGCGSCQNLLLLSELFPTKNLYGLDWTSASAEIAKLLASALGKNIEGIIFDMLEPPDDAVLERDSAVITIHSLEQIGTQHGKLLSFILKTKPSIVLHYEPIVEFYDDDNLLDYLALMYSRKRNYLSGFYTALSSLQRDGKARIVEARRLHLGGVIHDSSSLIVWKPM